MKIIIYFGILVLSEARLNKRIYGGTNTKLKKFPNIMSVQALKNNSMEYVHICAAVMVDDLWSLTSGQCISNFDLAFPLKNVRVKAGIWSVTLTEPTEQIVAIALYFKHEDIKASETSNTNDLGLIKLATKLKISEYVKPLPISMIYQMYNYGLAIIVGWGKIMYETNYYFWSDGLQMLKVQLLDLVTCRTAVRNLVDADGKTEDSDIIQESHICTGPLTGQQFICEGDAGGPLIINTDDGFEVIGIISYTILPHGMMGAPIVYTNISFFAAWIKDIMSKHK